MANIFDELRSAVTRAVAPPKPKKKKGGAKAPPSSRRASDDAVIWAGEQFVQPWDVPKPPPRGRRHGKTFAEDVRLNAPKTWKQREKERKQLQKDRVRAAQIAPLDPIARSFLAATASPERRKQMLRRPVTPAARDEPDFFSMNPIESARSVLGPAKRLIGREADAYSDELGGALTELYESIFDEGDRRELRELQAEAMATGLEGGKKVSQWLAPRAGSTVEAELAHMGVDAKTAAGAAKVTRNFVRNISQGVIGIAPASVALATQPREMGGELLDFYADFYRPLLNGDIEGFRKNVAKDPDMLLDWLGGLGFAAGTVRRVGTATRAAKNAPRVAQARLPAAARGLLTGKEPILRPAPGGGEEWRVGKRVDTRNLVVREGRFGEQVDTGIQQFTPRGALAAGAARGWDRVAQFVMPERQGRRRKAIKESVEANRQRVFAEIEGFRKETRNLQSRNDPILAKAFDRMLLYGGDAAKVIGDIQREIENRHAEGLNTTPAELDELTRLQQAAAALENPPADLLRAVAEGRRVSSRTQEILTEAGVLHPRTAERMLMRPAQWLEGMPEVTSPRRDQMIDVLTQRDWTPEQIDAAMQYMDAQAISYGRRMGVDPGDFYDEVYHDVAAASWEDINDLYVDGDDLLLQRGDEVPFTISPKRAAPYRRANEALNSDDPAVRAAAEARAGRKHEDGFVVNGERHLGTPTVAEKVDRVADQIPSKMERAEYARWYHDIWPEFERFFGDDAARGVRAFLVSQAAMSPADGLARLLYLLEVKNDTGRWPKPKFNDASMIRAWENANLGEDPKGIAAKLADFYGSTYGEETRTWMQKLDIGGPGVVDRWTLRSDGYLDTKSYDYLVSIGVDAPNPNEYTAFLQESKRLREKEVAEGLTPEEELRVQVAETEAARLDKEIGAFYDMRGGPTPYQYEWSSRRLNQMRDEMNARAFDGRTDWTVDEAQALDWFATRREWGQPGGGWEDTWARSTWNVVGDITGEMRKEWLAAGENVIVRETKSSGATGRTSILGTEKQAMGLAQKMADETGRPSYVFYDAGSPQSASRTLGTRKLGVHLRGDPEEVITALRDHMSSLDDDGLVLVPWGDGSFRVMFTDREGVGVARSRQRRDALVEALNEAPIEVEPVATIMGVVHGKARAARRLYRGDDRRGVLARAASSRRRADDFRVAGVSTVAQAERFVAGLQRNSRAWSLSPRAVDDFSGGEYRGFLTDDGNAGAAISPDGEIVSVFNSGSFSGAGGHVLVEAFANGGTWLNAYDGFLPAYYSNLGFREVARLKFSEEFAPPGWTYGEGRPDIVFMAYAPHRPVKYAKYVDDYDSGAALAQRTGERSARDRGIDSILEELANRGDGIPDQTLAQWKRSVKFTEGDPVIQGAVRISDEGVELLIAPAANFSTLVHENAHATMRASLEWLRQGDDPRLPAILEGLGIDDIDSPYTVEAQELFARAVETRAYMQDMPAPQLRRMMESTRGAMREAYRSGIKQIADDADQAEKIEALLKNDAFSTLLDDLTNVAYGATRSTDAVFIPRLPPTAPSRISGIMRRITGRQAQASITPPRKSPVAPGRSKNIRFESGEYRYGSDVIADYATATFRWELANQLANDIYHSPFAKTIEVDANGAPLLLEDHVPFVYRSVPGAMRTMDERLGMAVIEEDIRAGRKAPETPQPESIVFDMEPQEAAEAIRLAADDVFGEEVLPLDLSKIDQFSLEDLLTSRSIVQIPRKMAEDYKDALSGGVLLSQGAKHVSRDLGPWGKITLAPFAVLNGFARWSMIGKGAYATNNMIGSALTATAHNPFWVGELKKMSDHLSSWSPQSLRIVDEMVGAGTFEVAQLLDEAEKANMSRTERFSRAERQTYLATTEVLSLPERRVRRALMLRELKAAGYSTEAEFRALVEAAKTDPKWRSQFNQMARNAEDGVIRFRGMNETEQWIVRRAFFVYGWLRASLRYTARFPLDHPILAAVMNRLGNEGWDDLQEQFEKEIGFRGGAVVGITKSQGERIAKLIDPTGVLPFGTGTEILRALTTVPEGYLGGTDQSWETISDMFSPGVALGLAVALGESPDHMTPSDIIKGYGPAEGFAGIPGLSWIMRMNDPNYTETATFGKRSRWDVAGAFFFGQLWPRDTKLDAAHESWLRRQPTTVSAPIKAQQDLDMHLSKYTQATKHAGDAENREWTNALQAHKAYDTASRLNESKWNDLPEDERVFERRKVKLRVLKEFYPEAYATLQSDAAQEDLDTTGELIEDEYRYWVTDEYSAVRAYIREELGEDALD